MRAIVVGAGFAGLAAATALAGAGHDVVVLEARDRVGGRVWSRELPNGAVVEMGAEFVLPAYTVLRSMAGRLGLRFVDKGMRYGDREPRGGIGVDRPTLLRAARTVAEALAGVDPDRPAPSAAEFLAALTIDPGAREALLARVEVSSASPAGTVSAMDLAGLAGQMSEPCPSIAGGNARLAEGMAASLGSSVNLGQPAERIAWDGHGVRVSTQGSEVTGEVCVVSVPATVLPRIVFEPALPRPTADALTSVVYGHAAKLFVPLREVPEPSAVLSVPERYWTWTAGGPDGRMQPVVSCFAGSAPALLRLGTREGSATWVESVRRLRPDLALDPAGAVLSTWDDDPWVGAAYSVSPPETNPYARDLVRPVGPLFFCGEHTAGEFSALMEGALRSGIRAANQVLERAAASPRRD